MVYSVRHDDAIIGVPKANKKDGCVQVSRPTLDFCPDHSVFFSLLGADLVCFTIKMKFWCKIWYISIKITFQNKKKVPTDLPYFFSGDTGTQLFFCFGLKTHLFTEYDWFPLYECYILVTSESQHVLSLVALILLIRCIPGHLNLHSTHGPDTIMSLLHHFLGEISDK